MENMNPITWSQFKVKMMVNQTRDWEVNMKDVCVTENILYSLATKFDFLMLAIEKSITVYN